MKKNDRARLTLQKQTLRNLRPVQGGGGGGSAACDDGSDLCSHAATCGNATRCNPTSLTF
jgi:hypothetical protein